MASEENDMAKQKLWVCPICERRYKLAVTAQEPDVCPDCADDVKLPDVIEEHTKPDGAVKQQNGIDGISLDEIELYLRNISSTATFIRILLIIQLVSAFVCIVVGVLFKLLS